MLVETVSLLLDLRRNFASGQKKSEVVCIPAIVFEFPLQELLSKKEALQAAIRRETELIDQYKVLQALTYT